MNATNTKKRLSRLEDAALGDEPTPKMNFVFVQIDSTAIMNGVNYPGEADAVAAVPPGEEHIVVRVVDGRRNPSTETEEFQS